MGTAAYTTLIRSGGQSVGFLDEAMTQDANDPKVWQITDATRQVLDRDIPVVVEDNGNPLLAADFSIDYLFGIVTLVNNPAGAVTVSGSYIPMTEVVGASQHTINLTGDILDDSNYKESRGTHNRTKKYGMTDCNITLERFYDLQKTFKTHLSNRDVVMVEVQPAGLSEVLRGWFVVESGNSAGDLSALETESLSFQLDGDAKSSLSWRTV